MDKAIVQAYKCIVKGLVWLDGVDWKQEMYKYFFSPKKYFLN